ncbi:MAG: HAD-IA family hydrolase [Methylotenera sp.]|nr:HAD-IA family hydrolase [Oligoflexia bacterium]
MPFLIFDLDGTLIDSKRDIVFSVNGAFQRLGFPSLPEDEVAREIGRGSEYLFKRLLGMDTPADTIGKLVHGFKEIYQLHLLDHTQLYPGVLEALSYFSHCPKVIVTNKTQVLADQVIDGLGLRNYFEGVFGAEAFITRKPDPGPIVEVCRRWNVTPSETFMIGDSEFDITAGKAAGVRTIGALYGFSPLEAFRLNPPDFEIESADQLIGIFK